MKKISSLPSEGFVRISQIIKPNGVLPVGRTRWYDGIEQGEFPRPVKLGPISLWEVGQIRQVLERLKNAVAGVGDPITAEDLAARGSTASEEDSKEIGAAK